MVLWHLFYAHTVVNLPWPPSTAWFQGHVLVHLPPAEKVVTGSWRYSSLMKCKVDGLSIAAVDNTAVLLAVDISGRCPGVGKMGSHMGLLGLGLPSPCWSHVGPARGQVGDTLSCIFWFSSFSSHFGFYLTQHALLFGAFGLWRKH